MSFLLCFLSSISDLIANCKTGDSEFFSSIIGLRRSHLVLLLFPVFFLSGGVIFLHQD